MKWFGRKAGRDESRPALSRGYGLAYGSAFGDWAQGYEAQVRSAYLANPVAQRAVKLVCEGVGSAPLLASDPLLAALVQARSGGQLLTETVAAQLLLHGNAYVQIAADSAGRVAELYALRPERVTVEQDANGWPGAYKYRVGDHATRLTAEDPGGRPQVVHIRAFSPLDDHYGLGCLGVAAGAVAIHNAATRWNKALLDNAARPSGALVYETGDGAALSRICRGWIC
jgi:HK97 family phage portal protein